MGKDTTAFRERFNAYKNGKSVSEIYDAGLPRYAGGTPSEFLWHDYAADLLDRFEGFRENVYLDGKNIPTIGYGFTDPKLVRRGKISKPEAKKILKGEISTRGDSLRNILGAERFDKLADDTKAALLSYYYNYPAGFKDSTKMMTAWRNNDYDEFVRLIDAGMNDAANPGLRDRRIEEQNIIRKDPFLFPNQTKERSFINTTAAKFNEENQFKPWLNYHLPDFSLNNPAPTMISSMNNPGSPTFTTSELQSRRSYNNIKNVVFDIMNGKDVGDALMDNLSKNVFGGKRLGFKNGKLPGFRRGKIGHNVSRAQVNDDGTFTDDYTKVFEDMYVTPLKTDLKRNSHTWNSWNYYKSNPTAWMLPFMSSGTNEKGLELTHPEFDLLLGGRQIATLLFPLKSSIKDATEEMINFLDIAKKAAKMKADNDTWRAAHPEYEIENIIKKLKLPNAYDPAIEDFVKNANLEDRSLRSVFDKMLYENKDFHGKQIVNLHNNRAKLSGDFVDDAGQVFDVDTPEGYENAILFLEKHFFGTRDGAERLLKDPDFQSRLAGFSMPRGNKPVFISRNKLILRLERDLGRKLTLQEADDLYYKVISHERHHSFDKIHNTPEGFNLDGLSPDDYFVKNGFDELAARGTLLKNMFGLYKNPLTAAHLRYASSQYFKDPSNINNNMTRFFNMITDYDKAAKWLQENATAVLPYTVGGSIVVSLPEYKNGKSPIYIKPANRGKFNATKKRTGKTTEELAHSKNPLTRKRAIFALNSRKWKH